MSKVNYKKIGNRIIDILIGFVIVFALIISIISITTTKDGIPKVFGYSPFTIQSNSMYPTMKVGDLILVKAYDGSPLKKDDIISFIAVEQMSKIIKTHRVYDVTTDEGIYLYTTKGDNNEVVDDVNITDTDIVGVYTDIRVPYLGYVLDFLKSKFGFLFFILIPLAIVFIKQVIDLFKMLISYKLGEND